MRPSDQLKLLDQEIEEALSCFSGAPGFQSLLRESPGLSQICVEQPGNETPAWSLLPLAVCEVNCGRFDHALPVAAALHFLKTAAEVFDDTEDADSAKSLSSVYGPAMAVNAASALLVLAEQTLTRLQKRGVRDSTVIRVFETVNAYYTSAAAGQYMDLSAASQQVPEEEEYLEIAHLKSAFTQECACKVGALLAGSGQETIDKYAIFGYYLGMASQIANDIQGVTSGHDILTRKITLPAIFAVKQGNPAVRRQIEDYYNGNAASQTPVEDISQCLFQSGAIYYSLVKMELYKKMALDFIHEEQAAGKDASQLKLFIERPQR
ncbi:MAG: polyprenyl synthetase family protein [Dehalococcoidales bacterium]|nr:polyprenyl synthetase family protein [Dehalococcoidales bacterium]